MNKIKELYKYRHMISTLVKQDILGKYKNSILGVFWVLLNPFISLLIYTLLFQYIFKVEIPNYPVYLFIGLLVWQMLSSTLTYGSGSIVNNSGIIKKIYFPREVLPLAILIGNVINFVITLPIIFIALIISGIGISWHVLLLPLIIIVQFIFEYGLVILFAALNVYARDIEQLLSNVLFVWMYATPIVYDKSMVPSQFMWLYNLNPMLHIIEAYRDILYYKQSFSFVSIGIVLLCSILLVIIAEFIFGKLQKRFSEEL